MEEWDEEEWGWRMRRMEDWRGRGSEPDWFNPSPSILNPQSNPGRSTVSSSTHLCTVCRGTPWRWGHPQGVPLIDEKPVSGNHYDVVDLRDRELAKISLLRHLVVWEFWYLGGDEDGLLTFSEIWYGPNVWDCERSKRFSYHGCFLPSCWDGYRRQVDGLYLESLKNVLKIKQAKEVVCISWARPEILETRPGLRIWASAPRIRADRVVIGKETPSVAVMGRRPWIIQNYPKRTELHPISKVDSIRKIESPARIKATIPAALSSPRQSKEYQ